VKPSSLIVTLLLAAFAVTATSSPAASYDPLGSGSAKLRLDSSFRSLLGHEGMRLVGRDGAKVMNGKTAVLPIGGGEADPIAGKVKAELGGELLLVGERKRVPFTQLMVRTKRSPLIGKLGGGQLKIATARKVTTRRQGFGTGLQATGLELSAKAAVRLNKRLDTTAFEEGQALGTLTSSLQPTTVEILPTGGATLTPDAALVAKLNRLSISLNPIFPAELSPGPVFSLPTVLGGAIAPDASAGTFRTGGSLELLLLGAGQVFLHEFWFDLGARNASAEVDVEPAPPYRGKLGRVSVIDVDLGTATVSSDHRARTIAVSGARATLQASTAAILDEAVGESKGTFTAGELLGTVSFVAQAH
jgi:hypothetical protein